METKPIKKIQTSCPFPLLKYQVNIRYDEVRKPSGIAYIILELIQKSAMPNEKIAEVLKRFGIPADLHYIFARELISLCATDILSSKINETLLEKPDFFEQTLLGDFTLTPKGRKMFAEGAIPTGQEKATVATAFFSPVTREFSLACTQSYAPIKTSFLGETFMTGIKYNISGMEDYLTFSKTQLGLKKEEMITDFQISATEELAAKKEDNLTLIIDEEGVDFAFSTSDEADFFQQYYSAPLMSAGMQAKDKYTFAFSVPSADWSTINANALYIPYDAGRQAMRPCKLFVNRDKCGYSRTDNTPQVQNGGTFLDLLDPRAEFALLDTAGCKYYLPLNVRLPRKGFDDVFELHLLVEVIATKEQTERFLSSIFEKHSQNDYSKENCQILARTAVMLQDATLLATYAEEQLSATFAHAEKIALLLKLHPIFSQCDGWNTHFLVIAKKSFDHFIQSSQIEQLSFLNRFLSPLCEAMNMPNSEYIAALAEHLLKEESPELVYQAFEQANFDPSEILPSVNVVKLYAKNVLNHTPIDGTTKLANTFTVLANNLWKLCDMLGIESPSEYTLREDYHNDEFSRCYATFSQALQDLTQYEAYARESFAEIRRYNDVFVPIHELLSIEKIASEQPDKITVAAVNNWISRGEYSKVISNLLIKAQYDLRLLLGAERGVHANDLIDMAREDGYITSAQATGLHKLRMCRNALQHPEKKQRPFTQKDIEAWRDIVFSLKGITT